MSYPLVV